MSKRSVRIANTCRYGMAANHAMTEIAQCQSATRQPHANDSDEPSPRTNSAKASVSSAPPV